MAKLGIRTKAQSVVVCGAFANWDMAHAIRAVKAKGAKTITIPDMPKGEYRVFESKSFLSGEVYPTDGRQMQNRCFAGTRDDVIDVYFEKEEKYQEE